MTRRSHWRPTSRRSASSIVFLLSGEENGIPEAEAMSLTRAQDPLARFESPHARVLISSTTANPSEIEARIAYSRRVGELVDRKELGEDHLRILRKGTYAVKVFDLQGRVGNEAVVEQLADAIEGRVSLDNPDVELTVVRDKRDYLMLTRPRRMSQRWAVRRPRARAFFHPSAIFPKFSRLLVNLSGGRTGQTFLDPFCGTGSLLLEAAEIGMRPVGIDLLERMVVGAMRNKVKFEQEWLGVIRADSRRLPLFTVDAIATDIPYGRVSTTSGSSTRQILENLINGASSLLTSGSRLVVMHPESLAVEGGRDFLVDEELHVPVHKKLTRTITVLRRF